jgi:putative transposase
MSKPFTQLYYHLVWATYQRKIMLIPEIQENLLRFVVQRCADLDWAPYSVNCMEDHMHLAIGLPADISITEAVEQLKSDIIKFAEQELDIEFPFVWDDSFGAMTFAKKDLPRIIDYVFHQKLKHESGEINAKMENCGEGT